MHTNHFKTILKNAARVLAILSFATAAHGQQTINLTAAPTTATMPDGTVVPMWGYFCGTATGATATCAALNPASTSATWSPVVITVPFAGAGATSLTINLTNNLSFQPPTPTGGSAPPPNLVPTSIVIVGQVGGGLGVLAQRTTTTSPSHTYTQGCPSWFIAANPPGTPCNTLTAGVSNSPPVQGNRVQSLAAEVSAVTGTPASCTAPSAGPVTGCGTLTWTNLRPGTYLLESGTHQSIQVPMGLIGMLVVTSAPSGAGALGTAYPGSGTGTTAIPAVQYNAEVPLEFSEIDPVQNMAVKTAVNTAGFSETRVWSGLPTSPQGEPGCGNPASTNYNTCYPPVVNYTPLYYLINGVAFNKTNASASLFAATAGVGGTTGITGTVLARLVNAGVRMHVPSIVGSQTAGFTGAGVAATSPVAGFSLIAEDGNPVPGVQVVGAATAPAAPRVQTDVFMAAGKTFDVMVNAPAAGSTAPALAIYDRELSLSGNSSVRDAGMVAYIGVNGAAPPVVAGNGSPPVARADIYNTLAAGQVFSVSDPSKGLIANDTNVYGVTLFALPTNGTLTCNARPQNPTPGICANGTFTWTPTGNATSDTFSYCANGSVTGGVCSSGITATVTLGKSTLSGNAPSALDLMFTATASTYIKIQSPGLLASNKDPSNLPLSVALSGVDLPACTNPVTAFCGIVDPNGGFTASVPSGTSSGIFHYKVQNSQGTSSTSGTVSVTFLAGSGLQVTVVDALAYSNCQGDATCISKLVPITDYRWIIEEDKTFWVDPNCTTNTSTTTPGCPGVVTGPAGQTTVPTFGTNFHASHLDYVAQGCTGLQSCEWGQTMLDTRPACTGTLTPPACSTTSGMHIPAVCDLGNGACRPDPGNGTTSGGYTWVNPSAVHLDPSKRYYISVLPGDAANPFPSYTGTPGCNPTTGALPGPDANGVIDCGHTMGGAPIQPACNIFLNATTPCGPGTTQAFAPVTVKVMPTPLATAKLSVFVFEDDFPLNGEQDGGGGSGVVAPIEPGLGDFEIILWDTYGGLGDVTGQDTHDMFNQPLSNSLAGTIDPATGLDACPIASQVTQNVLQKGPVATPDQCANDPTLKACQAGITGRIVTCPKYESDNATLSPLAGQAVIANLMADKFSVQAYPAADRIARGEQWLQTNTLDGQHPHDAFVRVGEPGYFQEYGPSGYHVSIGFANPKIINDRLATVCSGAYGAVGPCTNTIEGQVDVQRISRTPDQRLYPSGSRDALSWTQCWVSLGDPDAEDFMFAKCDANGNFKFTGVPGGSWRLTIGDQWNDQIIDGLSTPANVGCVPPPPPAPQTCPAGTLTSLNLGNIGVQQWQSNVYTRLFVDDNKNGIKDPDEIGVPQVYTRVRYRDGHSSNVLLTDPDGVANFNETFPLFNWYVVEPDLGRYKRTGTHTVYDAGGPADGSASCGTTSNGARKCGSTSTTAPYAFLANTYEAIPLPADLSVPGAVYCATADCSAEAASFAAGTAIPSSLTASTGRIDPPWVNQEGWSGMTSQGNWIEFGVAPYAGCNPALPVSPTNFCVSVPNLVAVTDSNGVTTYTSSTKPVGENGGIHGHTAYASTRPFDDASQMIEQPWQPYVPNVTVNLYQEGFAADGVTPTLTMVDSTVSTSWDAWAQGFYPGSTAGTGTGAGQKPYMSCPGQGTNVAGSPNQDLFYFSLLDQPNYLDWYNSLHNGGTLHTLPYNSQYKCYDSMHIWNQIQPAPYDGFYQFPSITGINPTTGAALGTNCTICVNDPDSTDPYRYSKPGTNGLWNPANGGVPMLPPGKYVVEVVMPRGYEVEKEEDKNLLIGDNYVAPATVQFGGLGGSIFIMPDQASVASMYDPSGAGYNGTNYQNQTTALGTNQQLALPGFPGYQDPIWPCVGEMRVVPDYLSLFPQALETAPFAGATRPLCDRKEVTLSDQMSVSAKFYLFTSAHIASKFTGVITDDLTAEFDPFSPQFGEKFAPANLPVATKDALGNEISRVYADHWGTYESVTFSSWDVNPPNITGYGPAMMVQCMNDAGPILDTRTTIPDPNNPANSISNMPPNGTFGQMITDPMYNPAYSQFCYEEPYMPGLTTYLDTPVVPTQAFVGAAYNNPDCAYPDTTPAIKEVDGDGIGPWVSAAGHTLTITALGNAQVDNSGYAGPSANVAPFNLKKVQRHYGFGTQCTAVGGTCTAVSSVTIGGSAATIGTWGDTSITVTVPANVPPCQIRQQTQYRTVGGKTDYGTERCGQLVITAGNGKQSVDTVTVTIGGTTPTHVAASASLQGAIDAAAPGDLIIVDPTCNTAAGPAACTSAGITSKVSAAHREMVIMWKPVRLQGAGAASTIIDANAHPAGKVLEPWRRRVDCLFGLAPNGVPYTAATKASDCGGWFGFKGTGNNPQIDRLPLEATVGWDANLNGNIAELLQEPTLMGAYEGAGITVLAKGLEFHGQVPWNDGTEPGAFPAVTTLLTGVGPNPLALPVGDANPYCHTGRYTFFGGFIITSQTNPYPSNFTCNPSSIDGLTVENSSQGGGGIFVHGWAHHLQVANNRVTNNSGTLTGGISVGQGEFAGPYLVGSATNPPPGSCSNGSGLLINQHEPDCFQLDVNVHNNMITNNASLGDELFSATLAGGGGATFCTGNDYYKFNYNWVCGNLSAGEGGGIVHLGEIQNGDIEHNTILLNQSSNPTIPTHGGGIMVQGTPDTDPVCPGVPDSDCPHGLSDGTGRNLVINANLIEGNSADSGSGGGIRLNGVNGTEVSTFPGQPTRWNNVTITNNIINNNIAGWDGAGISLQDALNVSIVNNTIAHNDTLASSGVLTFSIGSPEASAPPGECHVPSTALPGTATASCPQIAGVASTRNSTLLTTTFTGLTITCPAGQTPATGCRSYSNPILGNNILWQNRSFYIGISGAGTGTQNQQNLVSLYDAFTSTLAPAQPSTGSCVAAPGSSPFPTTSYWDIGVRGDTGPGDHTGGTLTPTYSMLSSGGYGGTNSGAAPPVVSQYCNGSRVPPECTTANGCGGPHGFGVPPGISDAVTPNPVFNLNPSATVDEGNNWINVSWGPLALTSPSVTGGPFGNYGAGAPLANYNLTAAIDSIPSTQPHPATDFYGNARPEPNEPGNVNRFDPGAVEFGSFPIGTLSFTSATIGTLSTVLGVPTLIFPALHVAVTSVVTITNTGNGQLQITAENITNLIPPGFSLTGNTCSFTTPVAPAGTCTVSVTRPAALAFGALGVANNGTGTTGGNSTLVLFAP
jgi:FtsP/CotA-like multicopper oxidase with cupredoxin domain